MKECRTLESQAFADLCAQSQVISRHGVYGPKVLKLPSGHYLKVFNPKSGFTKRGLFPKYKTFVRNAEHLARISIPSIEIIQVYYLSHTRAYAVEYAPLEGVDLRSLAVEEPSKTLEDFIPFLIKLHEKGIYFRGIHLGNVLKLNKGGHGLIDMADLYFSLRPLSIHKRVRNLRHMLNNRDDALLFKTFGVQHFLKMYEEQAGLVGFSRIFYRFLLRNQVRNKI